MKVKKEHLNNAVFIIVIGLLVFSPLGFHTRVFVSRMFSFSPSVVETSEQQVLSSYHWQLSDLNNSNFDFKELQGKIILVNFWATWCPPCVAEMPSIQKLYNEYGDQIAFVLVASDDQKKVIDFLNEKKYCFPVYFEQNSAPISLSSRSIPTTYLIDANGSILIKKVGAADWNDVEFRNILDGLLNP